MTAQNQPEQKQLTLGFVPLLDAAPLIVALELGFFREQGLEVRLQREQSWAAIRDKVAWGVLDGAQMLAPLPLASTLGLGTKAVAMQTGLVLSQGGNAISLSQTLCTQLGMVAEPLAPLELGKRLQVLLQQRQTPLTLATVSPYSCHHYQLHYWLQVSGIDPRHVNVIGLPPAEMATQLAAGRIEGFCVGEPWNSLSEFTGDSRIVISSDQLWQQWPEKVFAVTSTFANTNPQTHLALLTALLQACQWLAAPDSDPRLHALLAQPAYLPWLMNTLPELPLFNAKIPQAFFGANLNFPWCSQAAWLLSQMRQLNQWQGPLNSTVITDVYRPDLYRQVATSMQLSAPQKDWRLEGADGSRFIDDTLFGVAQ